MLESVGGGLSLDLKNCVELLQSMPFLVARYLKDFQAPRSRCWSSQNWRQMNLELRADNVSIAAVEAGTLILAGASCHGNISSLHNISRVLLLKITNPATTRFSMALALGWAFLFQSLGWRAASRLLFEVSKNLGRWHAKKSGEKKGTKKL